MNKIIFIDDDKDILRIYQSIFLRNEKSDLEIFAEKYLDQSKGDETYNDVHFTPFLASQGQEGVDLILRELKSGDPIKVAFIDMRMPPGINGVETAKLIRQFDHNIELVFVTAYSDTDLSTVVTEVGHPDKLLYLKKPFDIAEIKQLALNLVVKYKNENIKNDFINNITHELKTPLSGIIGFHELLESSDIENVEIKEYLKILGQSARLMKSLIDDLVSSLELSKKHVTIIKDDVLASQFLGLAYLNFRQLFKDKRLEFSLNFPEELSNTKINIDESRILQVLNNLVTNAIKFTPSGGVVLGFKLVNNRPAIYVRDSGIGIPAEFHKIIFNKFYRIEDKHHNLPGLGLGLSIVKEIMDLHHAEIQIESLPEKGSCFNLIF